MKLPKTIMVLGRPWRILIEDKVMDDDGNEVAGLCDFENKTLYIDSGLPHKEKIETFIHEWLHAVWNESGIHEEDVPKWIEHIFIVAISRDIAQHRHKWITWLG